MHVKQSFLLLLTTALIVGCSDSPSGTSEIDMPTVAVDTSPSMSDVSTFDLFPDELIEPLFADIQSGSPLSVSNYPTFLSAYYRVGGSQLMQNITRNMDGQWQVLMLITRY